MNHKKIVGVVMLLSITMSMTAYAGTWKTGKEESQNKWWYANGDGSYAKNGWYWIDGNNDGVAECYYFDDNGWLLTNTTTPDGYQVNSDGMWINKEKIEVRNIMQLEQNFTHMLDGQYIPVGLIDGNGVYGALSEEDDIEMVRFSISTIDEKTILLEYNMGDNSEIYVWNESSYIPNNVDDSNSHYYDEIYLYNENVVGYYLEKNPFDGHISEYRTVYSKID